MKFFYHLVIGVIALLILTISKADITIDILGGGDQLLPVAILPVQTETSKPLRHDIAKVISNDLLRSGFFSVVKVPSQGAISEGGGIGYAFYRKLGIENVVTIQVRETEENRYEAYVDLYDVLLREKKKSYKLKFSNVIVRRVSHQISDLIFEAITGRQSAFSGHLAFVSLQKAKNGNLYSLKIADSDGYNAKTILKSSQPILSPAWSPDGKRLAYVSFENGRSEIFIHNPWKASRESIASFKGINSSPAWSPDGSALLMTLSKNGNSEIYQMDLQSKGLVRLTSNPAIDTEASYSADGKYIYFTSDRSGSPQIYRANVKGFKTRPRLSGTKQLTKKGRYNAGASLSQNGKYIALLHEHDKALGVSLYDIENDDYYPITTTFLDDAPSLSPGGNMLVYSAVSSNRKDGQLIIMDLRGQSKIRLRIPNGAVKDPAWGPANQAVYEER